jgi:hypothetical protein
VVNVLVFSSAGGGEYQIDSCIDRMKQNEKFTIYQMLFKNLNYVVM